MYFIRFHQSKWRESIEKCLIYPWIDFADETAFVIAIVDFDASINETCTLFQVIQVLNPNLFRISQVHHLPLQIQPKNIIWSANEGHRCVIWSTELSSFVECHWSSNVHITCVQDKWPSRRAFIIQNCFIVQLVRHVIYLKQKRII